MDARKLFEPTVTRVEIRRDSYLRTYMYDFIAALSAGWDREAIDRMIRARGSRRAAPGAGTSRRS
jgi:LysR family cys regulon transcriptional activator